MLSITQDVYPEPCNKEEIAPKESEREVFSASARKPRLESKTGIIPSFQGSASIGINKKRRQSEL
jgi:hypothetical protein